MPNKFQCEIVSLEKIYSLCLALAIKIKESNFKPDLVVAIARGGFVPARLICDFLHIHQLTSLKVEHYMGTDKNKEAILKFPLNADVKDKNVLIVDDVNDTGKSIKVALDHISELGAKSIKVAVMHEKNGSLLQTDYFVDYLKSWRWLIYEWAVVEDISSFIDKSDCQTITSCQQMLLLDYGLEMSKEEIEKIQPFLKRKLIN